MLRDEQLITFAKRAGLYGNGLLPSRGALLRFGKLVAAAEREACLYDQHDPLVAAARDILAEMDEGSASSGEKPELQAALTRLRSATRAFDGTAAAPLAGN